MTKKEFIDPIKHLNILDEDELFEFSIFKGSIEEFFLNHVDGAYLYWKTFNHILSDDFKTKEMVEQMALKDMFYALECAPNVLSKEFLSEHALDHHREMLYHLPENLPIEILKKCAYKEPWYGIKYGYEKFDKDFIQELRRTPSNYWH